MGQGYEELVEQLDLVMALVQSDEVDAARELFNTRIFRDYHPLIATDPYARVATFFYDLDDYLNNAGRRALGFMSKELILERCQEFLENRDE